MKRVPAFVTLCIITLVAAILLGLTNTVTEGPIAQAALVAANEARIAVMPDADGFDELPLADGSQVDNVYKATKGGQLVGYTSTVTTQGFGGPVEVTLGLDLTGKLTAVSVGGTNFQETAGLGAQAKEPGFTDQFKGVALPAALGDNVDAISGATITSRAVVNGINIAAKEIDAISDEITLGEIAVDTTSSASTADASSSASKADTASSASTADASSSASTKDASSSSTVSATPAATPDASSSASTADSASSATAGK